jgi:hypothetical protein
MSQIAISFASESHLGSLSALERTYKKYGIEFRGYTGDWFLTTEYGKQIQKSIPKPRGFFYWAWKPYIILTALNEFSEVLYTDAAVLCVSNPKVLFDLLEDNSAAVFEHGNKELINQCWTKRDTFQIMGCDTKEYHQGVQLTATFNLWKNTPETILFLEQWLKYCTNPSALTDIPSKAPNLPGFNDGRHDQSILSILSQKFNLPRFRDPSQWGNEDQSFTNSPYPQVFNHHRMRFFGN